MKSCLTLARRRLNAPVRFSLDGGGNELKLSLFISGVYFVDLAPNLLEVFILVCLCLIALIQSV